MAPKALGRTRDKSEQAKIDDADEKLIKNVRGAAGGDDEDDDEGEDEDDDDKGPGNEPGQSGPQRNRDGNEVIQLDDDEDEEDDESTRRGRRRNRGRVHRLEEELDTTKAELERMRGGFAMLQQMGGSFRQPQQQPAKDEKDPLETEFGDYKKAARAYRDRLAARQNDTKNPMTQAEADAFDDEAFELRRRESDIMYRMSAAKHNPKLSPEQEQQQDTQRALRTEFSDVFKSPRARAFADYQYRTLVDQRHPPSLETARKACAKAREEVLGIRASRPVDERRKAKFRGNSRAAGGGQGGGKPEGGGRSFEMTAAHKKQADEMYGYIKDTKARYKKYAKLHAND